MAPVKGLTILKLELCGVLAAKLLQTTAVHIQVHSGNCYGWTDSQTIFSWLCSTPMRLKEKQLLCSTLCQLLQPLQMPGIYERSQDSSADRWMLASCLLQEALLERVVRPPQKKQYFRVMLIRCLCKDTRCACMYMISILEPPLVKHYLAVILDKQQIFGSHQGSGTKI